MTGGAPRSTQLYRSFAIVALFLGQLPAAGQPPTSPLTTTTDAKALPLAEAKLGRAVKLRATVTYVDAARGSLFVQDKTAGIYVFLQKSHTDATLRLGQVVELTAFTVAGSFTTALAEAEIHVVGFGPLPVPKRLTFDRFLGTVEDSHWAEMEGVVHAGQIRDGRLYLNVAARGGTYLVVMADFPADWETRYTDAKVVTTGVLAAIFNDRRQSTGVRMLVPSAEHIRIEEMSPAKAWNLPVSPAARIGQFNSTGGIERRIRVRGTVMAVEPDGTVYLADRDSSLAVHSVDGCATKPGDLIDTAGYPAMINEHPGLADSICRKAGSGAPLVAERVDPDRILPPVDQSAPWGATLKTAAKFDLKLVEVSGTVLVASPSADGITMVIGAGKQEFTASLPGRQRETPAAGTIVRLTGVCVVNYDQYRNARSFSLLLRNPHDVVVIARPAWINLRIAIGSLTMMAALLATVLFWVSFLRRQVARQTAELRLANETLRRLSSQDGLTGLANRRTFDATLVAECVRSMESGRPLSLLLADIDHFKNLNDVFGHQHGDQALIQVAQAMESALGSANHLVARYGGEEFGIILPDTNESDAALLGEHLRNTVSLLAVSLPESDGECPVTISVGAVTLSPHAINSGASCSPAGLIRTADMALYHAKAAGRNRVFSGNLGSLASAA